MVGFGSRGATFRWRSLLRCSCSNRCLRVLRLLVPDEAMSPSSSQPPSSLGCGCLASCHARLSWVLLFSRGLKRRQGKDLLHFVGPLKNFLISTKSDHLPGHTVVPCAALLSFLILIDVCGLTALLVVFHSILLVPNNLVNLSISYQTQNRKIFNVFLFLNFFCFVFNTTSLDRIDMCENCFQIKYEYFNMLLYIFIGVIGCGSSKFKEYLIRHELQKRRCKREMRELQQS